MFFLMRSQQAAGSALHQPEFSFWWLSPARAGQSCSFWCRAQERAFPPRTTISFPGGEPKPRVPPMHAEQGKSDHQRRGPHTSGAGQRDSPLLGFLAKGTWEQEGRVVATFCMQGGDRTGSGLKFLLFRTSATRQRERYPMGSF